MSPRVVVDVGDGIRLAVKHGSVVVLDAGGLGVACYTTHDEALAALPQHRDVLRKARKQLDKENGS